VSSSVFVALYVVATVVVWPAVGWGIAGQPPQVILGVVLFALLFLLCALAAWEIISDVWQEIRKRPWVFFSPAAIVVFCSP
jgi:hypothetical protein